MYSIVPQRAQMSHEEQFTRSVGLSREGNQAITQAKAAGKTKAHTITASDGSIPAASGSQNIVIGSNDGNLSTVRETQ